METAYLDGMELEYEDRGIGEPVLFIPTGPIADSFLPLFHQDALTRRHRMVRYHQRGQVGSSGGANTTFGDHARDAAALLAYLGIERAHVAGHSTGAAIALQLAVEHPGLVHSLALLEPPLSSVPSARSFFEQAGPALEAYQSGETERAMTDFLSLVGGLSWETCRKTIDEQVPGGSEQAMKDAGNFFGTVLPGLSSWQFDIGRARAIDCPVLSVLGTRSARLFTEAHQTLRAWFPSSDELVIEGVGHLLHLERPEPVALGIAEFLARHTFAARQASLDSLAKEMQARTAS